MADWPDAGAPGLVGRSLTLDCMTTLQRRRHLPSIRDNARREV
jgi:hypothetical protein